MSAEKNKVLVRRFILPAPASCQITLDPRFGVVANTCRGSQPSVITGSSPCRSVTDSIGHMPKGHCGEVRGTTDER